MKNLEKSDFLIKAFNFTNNFVHVSESMIFICGLIGKFFSIMCVVSNVSFSIYFSAISFLKKHVFSLFKIIYLVYWKEH